MRARAAPAFSAELLLGPGGKLSTFPFYEDRPGQVALAKRVWDTLQGEGILLAEAGTGTGKSLAYLLPGLALGHRVVVSTRTKALQDQLAGKDLPLCGKLLGEAPRVAVVKGRANYLCLHYWQLFLKEPLLRNRGEIRYLKRLQAWAKSTKTGDKAEWSGIPENLLLWHEVNARAERCLGSSCPSYQECFLVALRRKAEAAQLVVTNHHLLFADLALKRRWDAAVLPEYGHLVLDEAHEAEDAATSFFGRTASRRMVEEVLHDAGRAFRQEGEHPVHRTLTEALPAVRAFFEEASAGGGEPGRRALEGSTVGEKGMGLLERMGTALDAVALAMEARPDPPQEVQGLQARLEEWRENLAFIVEEKGDGYVRWVEVRERNVVFGANPIHVGPLLQESLFGSLRACVLTSATLAVGGSFAYVKSRLGVPEEAEELAIPSPFDFASQGLLYVPQRFPPPSAEAFQESLVETVKELLTLSGGRAFVLCTSFKNMNAVAEALADCPFPLLVQGQEAKGVLLERFKSNGNAVLVATSSFWQGVDVQGDALSLVVLDKIPFAVPVDPLTKARIEAIRQEGLDPFSTYQVPSAAIALKQGAGRLIRSKRDRGVVACLDVRLRRMGYGRMLIRTLPPMKMTGNMADVERFFREGAGEARREMKGEPAPGEKP